MYRYNILVATFLISFACVVVAQTPARCFKFTWLGPRFNNESIFGNATCQEATRLANDVPCEMPLVVSEDGTWPDIHHIWNNYRTEATCELAATHVCAQYTYFFNGHVVNSTYMCTKAIDQNGNAITSGCFNERNGSFASRVCLCRSIPGALPCNSRATVSTVITTSLFLTAIALVLKGI